MAFIGYSIQAFLNISVIDVAPYYYIILGLIFSRVKFNIKKFFDLKPLKTLRFKMIMYEEKLAKALTFANFCSIINMVEKEI